MRGGELLTPPVPPNPLPTSQLPLLRSIPLLPAQSSAQIDTSVYNSKVLKTATQTSCGRVNIVVLCTRELTSRLG